MISKHIPVPKESSIRTGRVFRPVGQVLMHQGASLGQLHSLQPRAEQGLSQVPGSAPAHHDGCEVKNYAG